MKRFYKYAAHIGCVVTLAYCSFMMPLQAKELRQFDILIQSLEDALNEFSNATRLYILFDPELVKGKSSVKVSGGLSDLEALRKLLDGSNLFFEQSDDDTLLIKREWAQVSALAGGTTLVAQADNADAVPARPKYSESTVDPLRNPEFWRRSLLP